MRLRGNDHNETGGAGLVRPPHLAFCLDREYLDHARRTIHADGIASLEDLRSTRNTANAWDAEFARNDHRVRAH